MKNCILITAYLFLLSCASTNYVYVNQDNSSKFNTIDEVIVVVEYLNLKDDLKGLWDFEESINLSQQDALYQLAKTMLVSKGYNISQKVLKTSGLVMARDFLVDHYVNNQQQNYPIAPPYIIRSVDMTDAEIHHYEDLFAQLTRPVSQVMSDYRAFMKSNFTEQTQKMNYKDGTALLVIQAYKPRVSLFASVDIGVSTSSWGNGASIGFGQRAPAATVFAYFIDATTGQLLWSNKASVIKASNQQKFFNALPNHDI